MYGRQKTFKVKGRPFTYYPSESLSKNVQVVTVSHVTTSARLDELIDLANELDVDYETVEISSYDYELEFETKIQEIDEMYSQRMKWIENSQAKSKAEKAAKLEKERKEYERLKKKFGDK
jgi:MoaA/NifB/PqqE/SkfB family radical SAM enzyme